MKAFHENGGSAHMKEAPKTPRGLPSGQSALSLLCFPPVSPGTLLHNGSTRSIIISASKAEILYTATNAMDKRKFGLAALASDFRVNCPFSSAHGCDNIVTRCSVLPL